MRLPFLHREEVDPSPDRSALMQARIDAFWRETFGSGAPGYSPQLLSRIWVANRCIQLNAQQIASMPLRFIGSQPPAWITNPDPVWYPNGIGDAIFSAVWSMYGWGDAFLYITSRYSNGLPSGWTVLDPAPMSVELRNGQRVYKSGGKPIPAEDVVQITRNPHGQLRGTSAFRSYASYLHGLGASSELARALMGEGAVPHAILKSSVDVNDGQAAQIKEDWLNAAAGRGAAPAILPPELDFEQLAFSPKDLLLLDAQEFSARVIASATGVPALLLNLPLTGSLTYQNPEIIFDFWWRSELRPAAGRISNALTAQMLPRGNSVSFDARESLEPGLVDLHKVWIEAFEQKLVTEDEYRRAVLQIGPMAEGTAAIDELLQPPSAGASPADQPTPTVVALRPASGVMTQ